MHKLLHTVRRVLAPALFLSVVSFLSAAPNSAILSFSAGGVTGSFGIKLDPKNQSLVDVNSVSLTIDGVKFKNKDIVFWYDPVGDTNYIGGVVNGIEIVNGTSGPDFLFQWSPAQPGGGFTTVGPDNTTVQSIADLTITQKKGSGK
jgi:hypothetical protein